MQREFEEYGRQPFERLAGLSNSHLYRLRGSKTYRGRRTRIRGTRATHVAIGERRKPRPEGRPGFLRVDTVHQGDRDGDKGPYPVNAVDEVTQFEFVGAVEYISEILPGPRPDRAGQELSLRGQPLPRGQRLRVR